MCPVRSVTYVSGRASKNLAANQQNYFSPLSVRHFWPFHAGRGEVSINKAVRIVSLFLSPLSVRFCPWHGENGDQHCAFRVAWLGTHSLCLAILPVIAISTSAESQNGHHRRICGPSSAPMKAHNATIAPYHTAMNGMESSGQWKA